MISREGALRLPVLWCLNGCGETQVKTKLYVITGLVIAVLAAGYGYRDTLEAALTSGDKATAGDARADAQAPDAGRKQGKRAGRGRGRGGPVPVVVGKVAPQAMPRVLKVIGSAQAFATVAVKSRVDGQVIEAFFKEGQAVAKGDLLFRIDPRPFEVALRQAEANLERDRAQSEKAKGDLARYSSLVDKGFASRQKFEEARAANNAMKGTLRADEAAIQAARLQLEYTKIHAPIDGVTGNLLIDPGNLVKANDTQPLVVLTQIRPINVTFSVPERYLPRIKRLMASGPVSVVVTPRGAGSVPERGRLVFINSSVDTNTGTIQLKAEFANEQAVLTPGQFVNVALTLEERPDALVLPSSALQEGQRGTFVFVVKDDNTVEMRPIQADDTVDGKTVIAKGLEAGETVVLDGQLLLRPGSKVIPRPAGAGPPTARGGKPSAVHKASK